jgi:hypothetical protein
MTLLWGSTTSPRRPGKLQSVSGSVETERTRGLGQIVRYVYLGSKRQIAKKMSEKRAVLKGLGLGGQSPESLTIAEHIQALGNGSSRPAAPSSAAPQAGSSVAKAATGANIDVLTAPHCSEFGWAGELLGRSGR